MAGLLITLYVCPNLWNWRNSSNCTSEDGGREGPRWAGEITALQPIRDTQRQLVVCKTLNPRREVSRGQLAFVGELWSWHACARSAVIVEHFLHDRRAVESCASRWISFVSGSYGRDGERNSVIKSTALDLGTPGFEPHIYCGLALRSSAQVA